MPDVQVNTLVDLALLCLTEAVTGNPNPPAEICKRISGLVPHDADLYDDLCCEGLAYVSFGLIQPSWSNFPEPDIVSQTLRSSCGIPAWSVIIRMGIVRCVPTGTSTTMPTCEDWTAAAVQQAHDAQALRAASCCFRNAGMALEDTSNMFWGMNVTIGVQDQTQPQGGCVERNVEMTAQFPNCDCFSLS